MPEIQRDKNWRPAKRDKPGVKIINHPPTDASREGWERVWGKTRKREKK